MEPTQCHPHTRHPCHTPTAATHTEPQHMATRSPTDPSGRPVCGHPPQLPRREQRKETQMEKERQHRSECHPGPRQVRQVLGPGAAHRRPRAWPETHSWSRGLSHGWETHGHPVSTWTRGEVGKLPGWERRARGKATAQGLPAPEAVLKSIPRHQHPRPTRLRGRDR